ncbi:helix-turn-helix domain-containing protein [Pumilibacter intestinalis]|uniref:helix-turn-helix domain-containing protein n=1 Tax=Pumilibacter intestinalis TaxID=2941511 RepID=UPI00203FC1EB|nr:helix-turn-helix transcriptional regulator [Pumilibacter intestinalis]
MHGKIIRELREEHNLSQQQLAEKLNTTQNTISKYETEVLDLSTAIIHKLCDIFNVSSDYLLGRKDYCD